MKTLPDLGHFDYFFGIPLHLAKEASTRLAKSCFIVCVPLINKLYPKYQIYTAEFWILFAYNIINQCNQSIYYTNGRDILKVG